VRGNAAAAADLDIVADYRIRADLDVIGNDG
jgi:hypothetical protein